MEFSSVADLKNRILALKKERDLFEDTVHKLRRSVASHKSQISARESEISTASQSLDLLERSNDTGEALLKQQTDMLDEVENKYSEIERTRRVLLGKNEQLEVENSRLLSEIRKQEELSQGILIELKFFHDHNSKLDSTNDSLDGSMTEKKRELCSSSLKLEDLYRHFSNLKVKADKSEGNVESMLLEIERLKEEVELISVSNRNYEVRNVRLEGAIRDVEEQVSAFRGRLQKVSAAVE